MTATTRATAIGTGLQVAMVVIGHFLPVEQQGVLFPVAGTLLGGITGALAGRGTAPAGTNAAQGAMSGGLAGVLGTLVSVALGDVPLTTVGVAGVSTVVSGAIGGVLAGLARRGRATA
jgi:hypothetical protein